MKGRFKAKIYKVGINACVDVPVRIIQKMIPEKGYIKVKGLINDFDFTKTLVPVKNGPYRLFVNLAMLKGAKTAVGNFAKFYIEQNNKKMIKDYPVPSLLLRQLSKNNLKENFNSLTPSRRKDILKYLSYIKTEETLKKNIDKLIKKLGNKEKNIRIP
jgi:hypothetical protein